MRPCQADLHAWEEVDNRGALRAYGLLSEVTGESEHGGSESPWAFRYVLWCRLCKRYSFRAERDDDVRVAESAPVALPF